MSDFTRLGRVERSERLGRGVTLIGDDLPIGFKDIFEGLGRDLAAAIEKDAVDNYNKKHHIGNKYKP